MSRSAIEKALRDPSCLRSDPRIRASIHVGLASGTIAAADVLAVLPIVLDGPGALRETCSILTRARILDASHAFAIAASSLDPASIDAELMERVTHVLVILSRDRQATVATPAAAALGALALLGGGEGTPSERIGALTTLVRNDAPAPDGVLRRRTAVARAIQWLFGHKADKPLRAASGPLDAYAIAEVIRAICRWRAAAPFTADRAIDDLGQENTPTALHALGEYALHLPTDAGRRAGLEALRSRVEDLDVADPVIELWRGKTTQPARDMLLAWADLRTSQEQPASDIAMNLLDRIDAAVEHVDEHVRGPTVDAFEAALDAVLLASPILHDVLIATSASAAEAKARRKRWEDAVLRVRLGRFERLRKNVRGKYERREAVRRLAQAVDATPISAEPAAEHPASAKSVFAKIRAMIADNEESMLDRPLSRAFAIAMERAAPDASSVETLGLVLSFRADPFRKYIDEFAAGKMVHAARALITLRERADEVQHALKTQQPGARGRRKLARDLLPALREASAKMGLVGDHEIVRGFDDLVGVAVHLLHQRRPSAALSGVVADAIEILSNGMRQATASVSGEAPPPALPPKPSAKDAQTAGGNLNRAIQRRVDDLFAKPSAKAGIEAKREIERLLPPILAGTLDSVLALQGALDKDQEAPPAIIGDYQVVKALGAGGMGACLLVRSRSQDDARHYVLKLPQRTSTHYRSWFRREALALLSLADYPHKGIVRFVSFHDGLGGKPHLVMEWVDGQSLEGRVAKERLHLLEAMSIVADLASAVGHAHNLGIGHYDIKPANVVLHLNTEPVLVDWGIAGATCRGRVGTPYYMAPERLANSDVQRPLSSDVFSLACVLAESVGGKRLFDPNWDPSDEVVDPGFRAHLNSIEHPGANEQAVLTRLHAERRLVEARLDRLVGPCHRAVRDLLLRMLEPEPTRRPSAVEVERWLRSFL